MSLPDSILEIETAEIDVSSNVNFTFDWGTIGIIIGCVVGLLVVIFAIAFFCGRGRQKFSLKKTLKIFQLMKLNGYLWKSRKKDLFRKYFYVRATGQFQVIILN